MRSIKIVTSTVSSKATFTLLEVNETSALSTPSTFKRTVSIFFAQVGQDKGFSWNTRFCMLFTDQAFFALYGLDFSDVHRHFHDTQEFIVFTNRIIAD